MNIVRKDWLCSGVSSPTIYRQRKLRRDRDIHSRHQRTGKYRNAGDIAMKMKQFWFVFIVAVVFTFGGFLEVKSEADRNERESYRKQIEEKLRELDKKIKELKQKAVEVKAVAKEKYKEEMRDVRAEHKTAQSKLRELKKVGAKEWNKARTEMDGAVHKLENVYEKAASRFRQGKNKE